MPGMGDHPTATALYAAIVTALYRREKTGRGRRRADLAAAERPVGQRLLRAEPAVRRARRAPAAAHRDAERARQPLSLPRRPLVPDGAAQRGAPAGELPEGDRRRAPRAGSALRHPAGAARQPQGADRDPRRDLRPARPRRMAADPREGRRDLRRGVHGRRGRATTRSRARSAPWCRSPTAPASPCRAPSTSTARPRSPRVRAPAVGQHSEAVLRDAGYAADEIARLKALGVLQP